jgi:hypothetical protein
MGKTSRRRTAVDEVLTVQRRADFKRKWRVRRYLARAGLLGLTVGVVLGVLFAVKHDAIFDPTRLGMFLVDFAKSAGLGGIATLCAALIAVNGVGGQVIQARRIASEARARELQTAKDADWWKSFEWTTARVFRQTNGQEADLDEELSYELVTSLQSRARTTEQKSTCGALLNQIVGQGSNSASDEQSDERAIQTLRLYVQRAGDGPGFSSEAQAHLLELEMTSALRRLQDDGIVDEVEVEQVTGSRRSVTVTKDGKRISVRTRYSLRPEMVRSYVRFMIDKGAARGMNRAVDSRRAELTDPLPVPTVLIFGAPRGPRELRPLPRLPANMRVVQLSTPAEPSVYAIVKEPLQEALEQLLLGEEGTEAPATTQV